MSKCLALKCSLSRQISRWYKGSLQQLGSRRSAGSRKLGASNEDFLKLLRDLQEDIKASGLTESSNGSPDQEEIKSQEERVISEQMPLSPLMDPTLIKARRRFHETKALPSMEKTVFQTILEKNPYGMEVYIMMYH